MYPVVEVLLSTYNGAEFVEVFLESLSHQQNVRISLQVIDDGSTDETVSIVQQYSSQFFEFELTECERNGPAKNFMTLLKNSKYDFIAFADQDDIWHSDHLFNSISRLYDQNSPALTFTAVQEFDSKTMRLKNIWPKKYPNNSIAAIAFENYARGCVIVLNKQAVEIIRPKIPRVYVMHDWWALLVLQSCGRVIYSQSPEIDYRIHDHNFTSKNRLSFLSFIPTLFSGQWLAYSQLQELHRLHVDQMHHDQRIQLEHITTLHKYVFAGFKYSIHARQKHRMNRTHEFRLRLGLIFVKFLVRNTNLE